MTKEEFFDNITDIISDRIYLIENIDELSKEIENNHWSIGIDSGTAKLIDINDLRLFLREVVSNRIEQLEISNKNIDLLFYLWFDEQAGNLNFNFINSKHSRLPFGANLEFVDSIDLILKDFLDSDYLDGIPFNELSDENIKTEENNSNFVLKVYKSILTKSSKAQYMV